MKTYFFSLRERCSTVAILLLVSASGLQAQGTITFQAQSPFWDGTDYFELGMEFHVVMPRPSEPYHDAMVIAPGSGIANVATNPTPYMFFLRQNSQYDYVSLSLTGGSLFGITSVQLADPNSPSVSPVSISFVGYLFGGSSITNTFTTPGNGATTFANYEFSLNFATPQFTHVYILAPRWAMDNLVFSVPEPSAIALVGLGAAALFCWRRKL